MKRLIITSGIVVALAGCSSLGLGTKTAEVSPTPPVTKDQTIPAAGKLDSPLTIDLPSWYIKPPSGTDDHLWFAGTGYSSDLSMSREKAILDSQMKLADTINGSMNAMIKQQKSDNSGSLFTDKTSITIKKIIANTIMTGYRIEDSRVISENRHYRTFILVRYPVGDANRLLKDKLQQESQNNSSDDALQKELGREIATPPVKAKTSSVVAPDQLPDTVSVTSDPGPGPSPTAYQFVSLPTPAEPLPVAVALLQTNNKEYIKRRAEALQKPGAIVMHETLR